MNEYECSCCGALFTTYGRLEHHLDKCAPNGAARSYERFREGVQHNFALFSSLEGHENACAECAFHKDDVIHLDTGRREAGPTQAEIDATLASIATALQETP